MPNPLYVIEIVIGIGLLIFVHELGHFLMAKLHKVRVEAFSLGFPPNLWKKTWGDTEYRIGMIPLGGYVKMAGESVGEGTGKPDELTSKSAWARVQIFSAGAIINLLVAFPIAIIGCLVGRYVNYPMVSAPSLPEVTAGMRPGDTILEVNGKPIESLQQYIVGIVGISKGTAVPIRVRHADGAEEVLHVVQSGAENHQLTPLYTKIPSVKENSDAWKHGLRAGDHVMRVNGAAVLTLKPFYEALRATVKPVPWSEYCYPSLVTVTIQRPSEKFKEYTFALLPTLAAEPEWYYPEDWNVAEPVVQGVMKGTAIFTVLKKGDIIRKIDGIDVRSYQGIRTLIEARGGKKVRLTYERENALHDAEVQVGFNPEGKGQLGLPWPLTRRVALVPPGSPFEGLLESGDLLVAVAGNTGEINATQLLTQKATAGSSIEVRVERSPTPVRIPARSRIVGDVVAYGLPPPTEPLEPNDFYRQWGTAEAIQDGIREPIALIELTYKLLFKLVSRQEPTSGLSGPLGIFQASYKSAQKSTGNFFWILCLITVNLGIFNLLPIPVLDGGHILLLAIEKVRGRPNSVAFVNAFQMVGLVLLLGLVLFVTYGDIARFFN